MLFEYKQLRPTQAKPIIKLFISFNQIKRYTFYQWRYHWHRADFDQIAVDDGPITIYQPGADIGLQLPALIREKHPIISNMWYLFKFLFEWFYRVVMTFSAWVI